MNGLLRQLLTAWLTYACLLASSFTALAEDVLEPVNIATTEWPPYTVDSQSGIATEIVDRTLRGMKRHPNTILLPTFQAVLDSRQGLFGVYPYLRCHPSRVKSLRDDGLDSDPCVVRENLFEFSDPIMSFEYVIVVRANDQRRFDRVKSLNDLRAFRTRRVSGYSYGQLDDFIQDHEDPLPNQVRALNLLLEGSVDYVAISRLHYHWLLENEFFTTRQRFAMLDNPDQGNLRWSIDLHFLVPKSQDRAKQILKEFNNSLALVSEGGKLAERLKRRASDETMQRAFVILTDPAAIPLVTAWLKHDGAFGEDECKKPEAESYLVSVPRGTRAVVLDWSDNFMPPSDPDGRPSQSVHEQLQALSRVRIMNGPLKDHVVCVKGMFIELDTPE
jgi:hypothetical protein